MISLISFTAHCFIASGIGGALLSRKKIFNVYFIPDKLTFMQAGAIGTATLYGMCGMTLINSAFNQIVQGKKTDKGFERWMWTLFIPLIGIPYAAGVSLQTGITLTALAVLGMLTHPNQSVSDELRFVRIEK